MIATLGAGAVVAAVAALVASLLFSSGPSGPVEVVFERGDGLNPAVYGMSPAGAGLRRLVPYGSRPAWSPGGRRIAFVVESPPEDESPPDELWIVDVDTGNASRVLGASSILAVAWSPQGSRIALVTSRGWPWSNTISIVDLGDRSRHVVPSEVRDPVEIDWSADGRELLTTQRGDLVAVDVTTGNARIVKRRLDARDLDWSPDGRRIAYVAPTEPRVTLPGGRSISLGSSVFVVSADGSRPRRLTRGAVDSYPSWAPDGRTIVFARATGGPFSREPYSVSVYSVSVDGKQLRRLTDGGLDDRPDWRPRRRREPPLRLLRAPLPEASVSVPDVSQLPLADARRIIEHAGLKPVTRIVGGPLPAGPLVFQQPRPGERVPPGTVVVVTAAGSQG